MRTAPPSTAKPSLLSPEVEVKTSVINVYRAAGYNIPKAQLSEEAVDDAVSRFTYRFYEDRACSNCEYLPDRHSETCEDCSAYKGAACTAKVAVRGKSEYLVLPIGEKEKVIKWMKAHKLTPKVEDKFAVERPIKPFALVRKPWDYQVKAVADLLAAERGTVMSAPRTGKCLVGSTLVMSDKGLMPIKKLCTEATGSSKVATVKGELPYSYSYVEKKCDTLQVISIDGYTVRGTHDHPILVATPDMTLRWRKLSEVSVDDFLVVSRHQQWLPSGWKKLPWTYVPKPGTSNLITFSVPSRLTPELARLLGYLVANGNLGIEHRIGFTSGNPLVLKDYLKCLTKSFPGLRPRIHKDRKLRDIAFSSSWIKSFLRDGCDLTMTKAAGKRIPSCVLESGEEAVNEFLSGYVSCDSWVHDLGIQFCTASATLARQLHVLFTYKGLASRLSKTKGAASNGSGIERNYYNIFMHRNEAHRLLANVVLRKDNLLGPSLEAYQRDALPWVNDNLIKLKNAKQVTRKAWLINGEKELKADVGGITINAGKGIKPGDRPRHAMRYLNWKLLKRLDGSFHDRLRKFSNPDYFYSKITSIRERRATTVYDIHVPEAHHFVANGVVSHNTVMGAMCVQQLRLKTLILGHQREWLDNFMETFVGSKREAAFTDLDPKRIAFCSKVEQFEQTDIALATFQQFLTPRGKLTMQAIRGMFSLVIVDECFTYDHKIITDKGILKIGDIVSKGLRVSVLSYDHKLRKSVFKPCTSVTVKRAKQLCKVTVGLESFYCTPNHLWWVVNKQKWVEARSLEEGDELLEHRLLES